VPLGRKGIEQGPSIRNHPSTQDHKANKEVSASEKRHQARPMHPNRVSKCLFEHSTSMQVSLRRAIKRQVSLRRRRSKREPTDCRASAFEKRHRAMAVQNPQRRRKETSVTAWKRISHRDPIWPDSSSMRKITLLKTKPKPEKKPKAKTSAQRDGSMSWASFCTAARTDKGVRGGRGPYRRYAEG
jgi:hypothetical protein